MAAIQLRGASRELGRGIWFPATEGARLMEFGEATVFPAEFLLLAKF